MNEMIFDGYELVLLTVCILFVVCAWAIWRNQFFARRNVLVAMKPLPFLGNMYRIFTNQDHFVETLEKAYKAGEGQRYTGFFAFSNPIVMIRDLDLIKQVGIKDFDHFIDHKVFMDEEAEPLFGSNLFFLKGQKWRDMRATLSPAYTGSKMKAMYPFVVECAEQFVDYLLECVKDYKADEIMEIETKDTIMRYTNDVIASTAFGYKINSFVEKDNPFFVMGKKVTNFSGWQFFKFQAYAVVPNFMKFLGISLFPPKLVNFFRNLVQDTMKEREVTQTIRPDMIHLLMLAKKGSLHYEADASQNEDKFSSVRGNVSLKQEVPKREWSADDLTAQAVAFIVAGFGTPSSLLCFTCYELAKNPEVQRKLQEEIDEVAKKTNGKPTYVDIQNMKYIEMVIFEALRLWPPDGFMERVCVKSYELPPQTEFSKTKHRVEAKQELIIPIYSIHHDPQYFPEPNKFDPERFSEENKSSIRPFSFIPFGVGPRLCIGARFAMMEAKAVIFHLMRNFDLTMTNRTPVPFVLAKDTFNMHSEGDLWLGIKKRKNLP